MKLFTRILLICLLMSFLMGANGCITTDTVVLSEGPKATELNKKKDDQIAEQTAQLKAKDEVRAAEQALASKAASNIKGILKAREYLEPSLPSDAIQAEGELGLKRLPTDDPAETVRALERVVLIVTGQRDAAQKKYEEADAQTKLERAAKEAKDKEIVERNEKLKARDADIAHLKEEKIAEQAAHKKDVEDRLATLKKHYEDEQNAWFMRLFGICSIACVFIGIGIIAVSQGRLLIPGGILVVAGGLAILARSAIVAITAAPWFPYAAGLVILLVLGALGYALYRVWVKRALDDKKTQAIQDMIDENTTKGRTDVVDELKAHLAYRLGDKTTFWGKAQAAEVAALGLVNPKGEEALKAPKS